MLSGGISGLSALATGVGVEGSVFVVGDVSKASLGVAESARLKWVSAVRLDPRADKVLCAKR